MDSVLCGIEIGGTKLQIVTATPSGGILQRWRFSVETSAGATGIRAHLEDTLREIASRNSVQSVGVGFGGPVDWRSGKIYRSHQIEGWSDFQLRDWLQDLSGAQVRIDNDANVAALAEARKGAGRRFETVFYVTLGSGVGGGLVAGNRIYHGGLPGESEIGHLRLDRKGTTLESRCSGWAVDARIRELRRTDPTTVLNQLTEGSFGGEARHLSAALLREDSAAQKILTETAEDLAFGLSQAIHLFHPEIIILGGGLSLLGEPLRSAVAAQIPEFIMEVFRPGPKIALSALKEDAVPIGAVELARETDNETNQAA